MACQWMLGPALHSSPICIAYLGDEGDTPLSQRAALACAGSNGLLQVLHL